MEKKSSYDLRPLDLPPLEPVDPSPEGLRERAYQEGFQKGYEDGYREGREAALRGVQEVLSRLQGILKELEAFRAKALEGLKEEVLELSMAIARKVIRRELELAPSSLLEVVKEAIRRVTEDDVIRVHVSPEDLELVRRHRDEILKDLGDSTKLIFYPDPEVSPGGCFVETEFAEVDARIETQLEAILEGLRNGY